MFRPGRAQFEAFLQDRVLTGEVDLNPVCRALFTSLAAEYEALSTRLGAIDRDLEELAKTNPVCRALLPVPGVGVVVATALFSAIANISDFKTGRDLAAFLGLVPRQRSTGGRTVLMGISKRGNTYLCMMLIHGMGSSLSCRRQQFDWNIFNNPCLLQPLQLLAGTGKQLSCGHRIFRI